MIAQIKENPAALLALSWYWASDGIGSKVLMGHAYITDVLYI
jgi:glucose-6-phosphate isomerase